MIIRRYIPKIFKRQIHNALPNISNGATNLDHIEQNVLMRHHENNVPIIRQLVNKLKSNGDAHEEKEKYTIQLEKEWLKLPNETHARLWDYGDKPKIILLGNRINSHKNDVEKNAIEFSELCKYNKVLRMENLSNYTGHKSYYLFGALAELEHAIIQYVLTILKKHQFKLISVPDILPKEIIQACGMQTNGNRSQVYALDSDYCLSGTAEMSLAGYFVNTTLPQNELPVKVAAISRCYRAETSGLQEEKGSINLQNLKCSLYVNLRSLTKCWNILKILK